MSRNYISIPTILLVCVIVATQYVNKFVREVPRKYLNKTDIPKLHFDFKKRPICKLTYKSYFCLATLTFC